MIAITTITPQEYNSLSYKLEIKWGTFQSEFGGVTVGFTDQNICYLSFSNKLTINKIEDDINHRWPNSNTLRINKTTMASFKSTFSNFLNNNESVNLSLYVKGTPFQLNVWKALLTIPSAKLTSYHAIATHIAQPKAYRAVGTAIGANPIAYLIPCHRVIQKNGGLGGYRWGLEIKKKLLEKESF